MDAVENWINILFWRHHVNAQRKCVFAYHVNHMTTTMEDRSQCVSFGVNQQNTINNWILRRIEHSAFSNTLRQYTQWTMICNKALDQLAFMWTLDQFNKRRQGYYGGRDGIIIA